MLSAHGWAGALPAGQSPPAVLVLVRWLVSQPAAQGPLGGSSRAWGGLLLLWRAAALGARGAIGDIRLCSERPQSRCK